ncbi:restriction endonuclease subunit S [Campylobacter upsaliensis]|nr:restriction endonuclease subunit S [Campylobacter upsaliensis]
MKALNDNAHPLESLLQQHCPNGVEFKELGELELNKILNLGRGKIISQNDLKNCPGEYPVYSSSATKNGEIGKYGKYMFDDERITWSIDGGGKFFYRNHLKYSVTNVCGWIKVINLDELNTKFLFYALINEWVKKKFNYTKKAHPSIIKKEYCIPLPPLEIQYKIVEILDAFTELQAELEAELEARLKQYHYYRNKLLSHDELENRTAKSRNDSDPTPIVPYVRLGEVCEKVFAGGDLPKEYSKDKKPSGEFLYPIYSNGSDENSLYGFSKTYRIDAEAVTISARGTIGFHTTREAKFTPIVRLITLIPNLNKITNRFLNYALYTTHIEKYGTSAGIPQLTIPMLEKITIPLPPLSVQEEIVELLDKFDTLTNDLTSGIPAEIEARKKQYEYYRERLLSFIAKD